MKEREEVVGRVDGVEEDVVKWGGWAAARGETEEKGVGELSKAAERQRGLGGDVERRGRWGGRELGVQEKLEAKLGLASTIFADELGDGSTRDTTSKESIEVRTAGGQLLGREEQVNGRRRRWHLEVCRFLL